MVFIYLLEAHPRYAGLASAMLEMVEQGTVAGLTSTLTMAELLTAPAQAGDDTALRDYELYLTNFPHLTILPLTIAIARRAARVRAKTKLKMPDAIQIATAMGAGADIIIGNDKRWRSRTGGLPLLLLDDFLEVEFF
jgi:predicted nucleic acid-binding protein